MKASFVFFLLFLSTYHSVSCAENKDSIKAVDMYYEAKDLYYDGAYKKALKLFQRSLAKKKDYYSESSYAITKVYLRMAKCERRLRIHQSALAYLEEGLALVNQAEEIDQEHLADYYIEFGATYNQMYLPEKASSYYKKAIPLYEILFGKDSPNIANLYMSMGLDFTKRGHYKTAENNFLFAFDVFKRKSKADSEDFNRIYNNLGLLYRKKGDFKKALEYAENALRIKLLNYKETHPSVPKYYRNIGIVYYNMKEFEKAIPFYKKTIALEEKINGKDNPQLGGSYGELSNIYADLGKTKEAKKLLKKSIKLVEKSYVFDHPYVLAGKYNEARLEEDVDNYEGALIIYLKLIKTLSERKEKDIIRLSETAQRIGVVYTKLNQLDSALIFYDQAIEFIIPSNLNEQTITLDSVYSKVSYLMILKDRTKTFWEKYRKDNEISTLTNADKDADNCISIIKKLRRSYQSDKSKNKLNENVRSIFDLGVEISYELYERTNEQKYLEKALQYSEDAKANILFQHIHGNMALASSGIDIQILDSLQKIEDFIFRLESKDIGPLKANKDNSQLFDYKEKRTALLSQIEETNEKYYQLKYENKLIDVPNLIKNNTAENSISASYYYSESHLFSFVINDDKFHSYKTKLPHSFEKDIISINNYINDFTLGVDQHKLLIEKLQFYYNILILPLEEELKNKEHIVFIPHGLLQLMPFDLLHKKTTQTDFRELNYLIKQYPISCDWSFAFAQLNYNDRHSNSKLVGFAPSFNLNTEKRGDKVLATRSSISELSYNQEEVEHILKHFKGKSFLNNQATETSFINSVEDARIIHLATHALIDNNDPMDSGLLFNTDQDSLNDGFLSSKEIYNLKLSAELATMSACNTGNGDWDKLEGIYSLARAFIYAGCKSVISSLWLANDQSTSKIMDHFYALLSKGVSKDVALQKAKIHYLASADQLTAHPFFWAGMVLSGDSTPLQSSFKFSFWKTSSIMLIGVCIFYFLSRRRKLKA